MSKKVYSVNKRIIGTNEDVGETGGLFSSKSRAVSFILKDRDKEGTIEAWYDIMEYRLDEEV